MPRIETIICSLFPDHYQHHQVALKFLPWPLLFLHMSQLFFLLLAEEPDCKIIFLRENIVLA